MAGRRRQQDHFARRAKKQHYPARSIYKLEEIDQKVHLFKADQKVVDLGAAPGSWTLYVSSKVGPGGHVVAIDRAPMTINLPGHVTTFEANALDFDPSQIRPYADPDGFDVVISDMAPKTSGHRFVDQTRSYQLFSRALELGAELLRPGGHFVGKIFQGEDFEAAREEVRRLFEKHKIVRPRSVRTESYEIYLVGLGRRSSQ